MEKETGIVATEVLHLMKRSLKRMYGLLIIFIILFVISMVDSIYQRCRLIKVIQSYEIIEETEVYEMETENGNNTYVGGDNNGEIENN